MPSFKEIDATVILTEWNEFKNIKYSDIKVFDGRNILDKSDEIYQIGR